MKQTSDSIKTHRNWDQNLQANIDKMTVGQRMRIRVKRGWLRRVYLTIREYARQTGGRVDVKIEGVDTLIMVKKEHPKDAWHPWMERKISPTE